MLPECSADSAARNAIVPANIGVPAESDRSETATDYEDYGWTEKVVPREPASEMRNTGLQLTDRFGALS